MAIGFRPQRWDVVRTTYDACWDGSLDRPIVPIWLAGRDPGRRTPDARLLSQSTCHDLSIPACDIVDRIDYELSCRHFLGDSFLFVNLMSFGPDVMRDRGVLHQVCNATHLTSRGAADRIVGVVVQAECDRLWHAFRLATGFAWTVIEVTAKRHPVHRRTPVPHVVLENH